jgi:hypothetical protein
VHSDSTEVVAEAGFEEGTGAGVEGLTWRLEDFLNKRRHFHKWTVNRCVPLQAEAFGEAGAALSVGAGRAPAGAFSEQTRGLRGGNHLRRQAIGFLLVHVPGLVDGQLRVQSQGSERR